MQKIKHKLKFKSEKLCKKIKSTLYYKSLKSINLKHLYSSLADGSFLIFFSIFSLLSAFLMEKIFSDVDINTATSEEVLVSMYSSVLNTSLFIILIYLLISIFLFSFSRYALYSLLIKKWHGWKNYLKYYLFNLGFFFSILLLLLFIANVITQENNIQGIFGLLLFVYSVYVLIVFNIIYFKEMKILVSLKKVFKQGFGFLERIVLGVLTIFLSSFIITLFMRLLHLLNFSNNTFTTKLILYFNSAIITIIFFILMAWLRDYLIQYYSKKLK